MLPEALTPRVFDFQEYWSWVLIAGRIKAAAGKSELSVKSRFCVFQSIDLDHAAHLPAKFRGKAGGINLEGFHVIGFEFRSEAWRTVVGERNAVHHKLRLIFRSARVENRIAFVEPARFRVHQILHGAAGQRGHPILDRLRADLIYRTGAIRIDQRAGRDDRHRFGNGSQFQLDRAIQGKRGTDFNRLGERRKALQLDLDLVDSIGQALDLQMALSSVVNVWRYSLPWLTSSTALFSAQSGGIGDGQTQFPGSALRQHGKSPQKYSKKQRLLHLWLTSENFVLQRMQESIPRAGAGPLHGVCFLEPV